jgi:hypothetical protein
MQRRVASRRRWEAAMLLVEALPAVARWARLAQMAATRWAEALAVGVWAEAVEWPATAKRPTRVRAKMAVLWGRLASLIAR